MPDRARKDEKFLSVNADTLDNILRIEGVNVPEVNWIKIDVEGAEVEVLKGATATLSQAKNISVLVEVHGVGNYMPLKEILSTCHFQIEFETSNKE